jgi:hypothetical protein
MVRWVLTAISLLIGITACGSAQEVWEDAGSVGLASLKIGVGARAVALEGAVSALTDDASAIYWNPANLALIDGTDFVLSHNQHFQSIRFEYAALAYRYGDQVLGISAATVYTGDLELRDEIPRPTPIGTFRCYDVVISGSYARSLSPEVNAGLTLKGIHEKIYVESMNTYAMDAGILYRPAGVSGLSLAAAIRNLGPKTSFNEESFSLPTGVTAGLAWEPSLCVREVYPRIAVETGRTNGRPYELRMGLELYGEMPVTLRFGYRFAYTIQKPSKLLDFQNFDQAKVAEFPTVVQKLGFGLGLVAKSYRIDYAYLPYQFDLGGAHHISLGRSF